jgi:hypothetical protein
MAPVNMARSRPSCQAASTIFSFCVASFFHFNTILAQKALGLENASLQKIGEILLTWKILYRDVTIKTVEANVSQEVTKTRMGLVRGYVGDGNESVDV